MHKDKQHEGKQRNHEGGSGSHYSRLLAMILLSFLAMYALMYAMVNSFDNVFNSANQFYMAGLMAAPMMLIELVLMSRMYPNRTLNVALSAASIALMVLFWIAIRQQVAVSDRQFLRSMIPHHAGAVLMCENNRLSDPELQQLCRDIVTSQRAEIDLMKTKLQRGAGGD
jgi:small-conductance mechanosensitive channel